MLAPRRHCLDYSEIYSDITEITSMESEYTYYILHISSNSEIVLIFLIFAPTSIDDSTS